MANVVCDTNIYISAYNFGGVSRQVLLLMQRRDFKLFISEPILIELKRILSKKFGWSKPKVDELIKSILAYAAKVIPGKEITRITSDPTDNRILECAVAAQADFLISGDHSLLELKNYQGITVLTPRQFLDDWQLKAAA